MHDNEKQIPIWFFIGVLLAIYGLLILCSGIYNLISPPEKPVAMSHLHADIWWSILLLILGSLYTIKFWPSKTQE